MPFNFFRRKITAFELAKSLFIVLSGNSMIKEPLRSASNEVLLDCDEKRLLLFARVHQQLESLGLLKTQLCFAQFYALAGRDVDEKEATELLLQAIERMHPIKEFLGAVSTGERRISPNTFPLKKEFDLVQMMSCWIWYVEGIKATDAIIDEALKRFKLTDEAKKKSKAAR